MYRFSRMVSGKDLFISGLTYRGACSSFTWLESGIQNGDGDTGILLTFDLRKRSGPFIVMIHVVEFESDTFSFYADRSCLPSSNPSVLPSLDPSSIPSETPSTAPSSSPTEVHSIDPSVLSSLNPSSFPSETPSTAPSSSPTEVNSLAPSVLPSLDPPQFLLKRRQRPLHILVQKYIQ